MNLRFRKMHGAGNDFLLIDNRADIFPDADREQIARLCRRRTGIGADGVVLLMRSARADVRVRFFNADGGEAEMCGNALRCAGRFAFECGAAGRSMTVETVAGLLEAEVLPGGGTVRLQMTPPSDWRPDGELRVDGAVVRYGYVNTGVPHTVIEETDLPPAPAPGHDAFLEIAPRIRRHPVLGPAGANVNAVRVTGPASLSVRTFERGVEGETLACGTGVTACALVMARRGRVVPPVGTAVAGGDVLTVDFQLTPDGARNVTLCGPTVDVFEGTAAL